MAADDIVRRGHRPIHPSLAPDRQAATGPLAPVRVGATAGRRVRRAFRRIGDAGGIQDWAVRAIEAAHAGQ
jgi:hypothetical protein